MEKSDALLARLAAQEVLLTCLASHHPDRTRLLAEFDQASNVLVAHFLHSAAQEEFVQELQTRLSLLRTLIS